MKQIWNRIKTAFQSAEGILGKIALFVIGWIIIFDTFGGCIIPIVFKRGCGWFSVVNLLVDSVVIAVFVKYIIDQKKK